jgi:arginine/serine-rich splicing factor 4/5/6
MTGFGFVEFESSKDADDAVQHFNGKAFMGTNIVVEFAKESRPRRDPYDDRGHGAPGLVGPPVFA